jgi:hypothetical protein
MVVLVLLESRLPDEAEANLKGFAGSLGTNADALRVTRWHYRCSPDENSSIHIDQTKNLFRKGSLWCRGKLSFSWQK